MIGGHGGERGKDEPRGEEGDGILLRAKPLPLLHREDEERNLAQDERY
jgi:hypothetical protein